MADFYLKSGSGVTQRDNSTVYALGARMVPARADVSSNAAVCKRWVWECTTAGTSGAAVPTWDAAPTQDVTTITDNTVTWTCRKPGFSSGTTADWTFATIFMDYAATAMAVGDTLYVSSGHSESVATAYPITFPGTAAAFNLVLSVSDSVAPPTTLTTGAVVTTTGASNITVAGGFYMYGVRFNLGTGASAASFTSANTDVSAAQYYDTCQMHLLGTAAASRINLHPGNVGVDAVSIYDNCQYRFSSVSQAFAGVNNGCKMIGGGLVSGTSAINSLFVPSAFTVLDVTGVDFSLAATAVNVLSNGSTMCTGIIRGCKMPASWSGGITASTLAPGNIKVINCDSADTNYRFLSQSTSGTVHSETGYTRTGGASDGTTPLSWKLTTTTRVSFPGEPLCAQDIAIWNETTGSAITLTVEVLTVNTVLEDDDLWIDVMYQGTSGSSLSSIYSTRKSSVLASATSLTTSSATWTTTANRANSTVYALDASINVQGRIWVCTVAGTSAASEPAGYASGVDGDTVTDGTASFRAVRRQKLVATVTPQEKGVITCTVKAAVASLIIYVDPYITVT